MSAPISHFAINADDVSTTRRFYERLLGWSFTPWGPPGFFHIDTGSTLRGALQQRRDLGGVRVTGFECTVSVPDVSRVASDVQAAGGRLVAEAMTIEGVGELIWLADPAGNIVGAMEYIDNP